MDQEAIMCGNLATEANLIILDVVETILQVRVIEHCGLVCVKQLNMVR